MNLLKFSVGDAVGYWTVQSVHSGPKGGQVLYCKCRCGNGRTFSAHVLAHYRNGSCGCSRGAHRQTAPSAGGITPTYSSWRNMIARCTQPSNPAYEHYKNKGVTVHPLWRSFSLFFADMGERPPGTTLDRFPDNNGNYEPGNCRWATKAAQANNRSTNVTFEYRGTQYTLAELARATGVSKGVLRSRLCRSPQKSWTVEGAVHTPKQTRRNWGECC